MNKLSTGIIIGGLVGLSSVALMNMDSKDMRRAQRKGKRILHKAEDLMDDIKGYM